MADRLCIYRVVDAGHGRVTFTVCGRLWPVIDEEERPTTANHIRDVDCQGCLHILGQGGDAAAGAEVIF